MKGKLYLNNELTEAEITIPLSFISNELNNLNDKRAGMSGTIIIDKTEKYHEDSDIWNSAITCNYFYNGIKLVTNGDVRLLKFTDKEVHLKVYFGAILLQNVLKELKINELIDETLNIEWNLTEIVKSCETEDVFFMFANTDVWEEDEFITSNKINAKRLVPAIKARKIIELIEDETGITITGDFADDELIDSMCMPLISNNNIDIKKIEAINTASTNQKNVSDHPIIEIADSSYDEFTSVTGDGYLNGTDEIKVNDLGNYDIDVNYKFGYRCQSYYNNKLEENDLTITSIRVRLYKVDAVGAETELAKWEILNETGLTTNMDGLYEINDVNLKAEGVAIDTTDKIMIKISFYVVISCGVVLLDRLGRFAHYTTGDVVLNKSYVQFDGEFDSTQLLPNITALEFIKSLIQKKGFILDFDFLNEKFILNYFNQIYKNLNLADDWSSKFVSYEITDIYGVYGRNNLFQYTNDKDIDENYGGYNVEVDKQPLPQETIILKDITAGTLQEDFTEGGNAFEICRVPLISEKSAKWEKLKPRFLLFERKTIDQITITDGLADVNVTDINYVWFTDYQNFNLDWTFLAERYYTDFVSMFDRYRKYTIVAHLNTSDLIREQLTPVYIRQLNAYFFI